MSIRAFGIIQLASLVARDTQLIPELGAIRFFLDQFVIESRGRLRVASQQQHLGFRLLHQQLVFATLGRQTEFAQRLVVQGLLTEGETQIVVRECPAFRDVGLTALANQLFVPRGVVAIQRQVRLRVTVGGIQLGSPCSGLFGLHRVAELAVNEGEKVMRFGQVRIEPQSRFQRVTRFVGIVRLIEQFAVQQMRMRALRLEHQRSLQ